MKKNQLMFFLISVIGETFMQYSDECAFLLFNLFEREKLENDIDF